MRSFAPPVLSRYISRMYVFNFLVLLGGLLAIVYLFDTVELLRRAAKYNDIPLALVLKMGLLKLPEVGQMVFPFAVLFSGMFTFWKLARRHELVTVRAAGLSAWQFLAPVLGVAILIGILQISVINPLGAVFIRHFESLEDSYLERGTSLVSLSEQGLWLRQDHEDGQVILHAAKIQMPDWTLDRVIALFFAEDGTFQRRIDADSTLLEPGQWMFRNVVINRPGRRSQESDFVALATSLTAKEIEDSFSAPETIPFWSLPSYIEIMESAGFDSTSLRIHLHTLMARPLFFAAMILLAATVSLRPPRLRGTSVLVVAGVLIGFVVFFMTNFLQALGASGQIPVVLAAWFPPAICSLLGLGAILVLEDG